MTNKTFYITTAIDYASGNPHIGHAYEKVCADIVARWNRNCGKRVYYQTGTDEHGQKVLEKSQEANQDVEVFAKEKSELFEALCKKVNSSEDFFIKTTMIEHKKLVEEMLQKTFDNGDIYKGEYKGLYCVGCEKFYTEKDLVNGTDCPDHKKPVQHVKEETYFFKLSNYQDKLLELYEKNPKFISPSSKSKEIINRVKEDLQDVSISRLREKLPWGVDIPFDKDHVSYVWFDALYNYYTGTQFNDKKEFWPADVHIIGHDIGWFHTVYWPAFLMSVGIELPKRVFLHGMILDKEGHKMSKSLGNVIDPLEQIEKFGVDEFRFYLSTLGPYGEDLQYSEETCAERINNELNNDLGNLVSRVHAMTGKYCGGEIKTGGDLTQLDQEFIKKLDIFEEFDKNIQNLRFHHGAETLWAAIREANAYINTVQPWKEQDEVRLNTIMNVLVSSVRVFAEYVDCFMPEKAQRMFKQLNFEKKNVCKFTLTQAGHKLGEKDNIFQKIKLEQKEEVQEKREGFGNLKLVVGKIIEVGHHPEADKLFKLKVDIGEDQPRQVLTGLRAEYKDEELANKKVVIIANLKPAKMRGEISQGMLLAAENKEGVVGILIPEGNVGEILECDGVKADNEKRIKIDDFTSVVMISEDDKVEHNNKEITASGKTISIDRNVSGQVH